MFFNLSKRRVRYDLVPAVGVFERSHIDYGSDVLTYTSEPLKESYSVKL
ncbi:MAG: hypothetical protein V7L01_12705 [Nostoc sp.]